MRTNCMKASQIKFADRHYRHLPEQVDLSLGDMLGVDA